MLTKKQRDLLVFINDYLAAHDGASPSFEEMKEALDLRSKSGIHRLLEALEERGFLSRMHNKARAIEIMKMPGQIPPSVATSAKSANNVTALDARRKTAVPTDLAQIPLHGKIAAGTPIEAIRHEQDTIGVPVNFLGAEECYALEVEGDSMVKAGIMDGDIVIIERCNQAKDGEIVVALVNDEEATLKRYRREIGKVALLPENDSYEPIRLRPDQVKVQGRLKSLFRHY